MPRILHRESLPVFVNHRLIIYVGRCRFPTSFLVECQKPWRFPVWLVVFRLEVFPRFCFPLIFLAAASKSKRETSFSCLVAVQL